MTTQPLTVQRHYDQVIAPHYDQDPQSVLSNSLGKALNQLRAQRLLQKDEVEVLDVGVGTGLFLCKLRDAVTGRFKPCGLDLSEKMIEIARGRVPELEAAADDAANLDAHFDGRLFDLVCTHFITGFVPASVLAPKIIGRLRPGGCWSLVAGTRGGFPALQSQVDRTLVRLAFGGNRLAVQEITCNPAGRDELVELLTKNGFEIAAAETLAPPVRFRNLEDFLEFGYRGGWLTPFVEALGLDRAGWLKRKLINLLCFPIADHHEIEIILARKPTQA
jgi:SAM-dependent methyltransferase